MNDTKGRGLPPRKPPEPATAPPSRASVLGGTGRFERLVPPRDRSRVVPARHSAITRNLQNYASYKSWADKMRVSWEPDKEPDA